MTKENDMSHACLSAWDASQYTSGECDAVHPMYSSAFDAGYKSAIQEKTELNARIADKATHIKQPYTLQEIRDRIASNDYSAELLLQHAMLIVDAQEKELESVGAGGVHALSAVPAGWKLVPVDATDAMVRATDSVNFANADTDGTMHDVWHALLAASPTPPAEQPAMESVLVDGVAYPTPAPVAGELLRLHLELRAATTEAATPKGDATTGAAMGAEPGAVYAELPNLDSGEEPIWHAIYEWKTAARGADANKKANAVDSAIIDQLRDFADRTHALRQARTTLPEGWTACTIQLGNDGPEEVAYGPKRMMTRLAKWLGKYFAQVIAEAAPKAAPGEPNTVPAELLEQAYREGWAACRDAETIGEEAENWAFGNSTANSRMIDAQQAAPQPAPAPLSGDVLKKAARYDFLRDCDLDYMAEMYWPGGHVPTGDEFDAAIDTALAAQGGK